jgi:hypothetical protein
MILQQRLCVRVGLTHSQWDLTRSGYESCQEDAELPTSATGAAPALLAVPGAQAMQVIGESREYSDTGLFVCVVLEDLNPLISSSTPLAC